MEKFIYSQAIATFIVMIVTGVIILIGKKTLYKMRMRKRFIERIDNLEERIRDKEYTEHDLLKFANDYIVDSEKDLFKFLKIWKEKRYAEF